MERCPHGVLRRHGTDACPDCRRAARDANRHVIPTANERLTAWRKWAEHLVKLAPLGHPPNTDEEYRRMIGRLIIKAESEAKEKG